MINTDTFLKMGRNHKICQDYIISGTDPFPYVILSDGCSSSENTDVGSRILAHSAKQFITNRKLDFIKIFNRETKNGEYPMTIYYSMGERIIHKSLNLLLPFDLNESCLNATLIVSFCIDNILYVYMYGDGFVIYGNEDNLIHDAVKFTSSAPFYLNYLLDTRRNEDYHNTYGITKVVEHHDLKNESENTKKSMDSNNSYFVARIDIKDYDFVLISSDGVDDCIDDSKAKKVPFADVLQKVTAFKDYGGEFVLKRMKRYFRKLPNYIYHGDDVSIGGFHYTPED